MNGGFGEVKAQAKVLCNPSNIIPMIPLSEGITPGVIFISLVL